MEFWRHHYPEVEREIARQEATTTILPREEDRLKVFSLPLPQVRVVILGQDPYPTKGFAHGYAFSVLPHIKTIPASLRNIYNEYTADLDLPRPVTGDLRPWHRRGVLLLNTSLTVVENQPGSHHKLWSKLTYEVLSRLSHRRDGLVFMLWGRKAQEYKALLDQTRHLVLTAGHPSPFSYRQFAGCRHFSRAAEYLNVNAKEFWRLR